MKLFIIGFLTTLLLVSTGTVRYNNDRSFQEYLDYEQEMLTARDSIVSEYCIQSRVDNTIYFTGTYTECYHNLNRYDNVCIMPVLK